MANLESKQVVSDNPLRILLVEDVLVAQKIALYALETYACQVDVVGSGADALDAVKQQQYDLIFMDLGLPDIDGLTVTETIRRTMPDDTNQVPIVALTAHLDEQIKEDSLRAGMTDYVVKPLTNQSIASLLQQHVPRYKTQQVA